MQPKSSPRRGITFIVAYFFRFVKHRQNIEDGKDGEKESPNDTGRENAANRVLRPKNRDGGIERKYRKKEETAIGYPGIISDERMFAGVRFFGGRCGCGDGMRCWSLRYDGLSSGMTPVEIG